MWLVAAILSSLFAGATSILAKLGIKKTDSDVATSLRTVVVLIFSWIMVFVVGSAHEITKIDGKCFVFLILSGFATGASWLCYFKALSIGDVNKVVPVDKSSTVLTIILAIVFFGETSSLAIKLVCTAALGVGIFLMIEKKGKAVGSKKRKWLVYAILSAVFASLTSVFAKVGINGIESNLGTAIRTCVVLVMAFTVVFVKNKQGQLNKIDKSELVFIILSGFATGASWLCYYYAIKNGSLTVVIPIDKMSVGVSVAFSYFVFREKLSKKAFIGLLLMLAATVAMALFT